MARHAKRAAYPLMAVCLAAVWLLLCAQAPVHAGAGGGLGMGAAQGSDGGGGAGPHNVLSATHTDSVTAAVVRGDLIVGNSTPAWDRLAVGATGTVLVGGTDPSWDASPQINEILLNNTTQDIRLFRDSTRTLRIDDNNAGADASMLQVGGANASVMIGDNGGGGSSSRVRLRGPGAQDHFDFAAQNMFMANNAGMYWYDSVDAGSGTIQGQWVFNSTTNEGHKFSDPTDDDYNLIIDGELFAHYGIENHTAGVTLTEDEARKINFNTGAAGTVTITLPTGVDNGVSYKFIRVATQAFRVDPNAADNIVYSGGAMANGEYLELASDGAKLELVYDSANTQWNATLEFGTLTEETP